MHDASREFVLVGTGHSSDLKSALMEEKQRSKALEDNIKELDIEVKKADDLLYRLLPRTVADRLRTGEPTINLCEVR
jgi:guanylate cyclase